MRSHRRSVLKGAIAAGVASIAAALGLRIPRLARAAEWPRDAFDAETLDDALRNLYGTRKTVRSPAVKIRAPARVESGAVVPVSVSADLPDVQAVSILIDKNVPPLAAHVNLSGGAAFFFVNVKMASTSDVLAVVNSGGKLHIARHNVDVGVGA